jgi:hypothetical protein
MGRLNSASNRHLDPASKKMLLSSPEGFNSKLWGPGLWRFMHYIALNYPISPTKEQIESYKAFFQSLCNILPCNVCRKEFCNLVTKPQSRFYLRRPGLFPYKPKDPGIARLRLFTWTSDLHNAVSGRLKKPTEPSRTWLERYLMTRHHNRVLRIPVRAPSPRPRYPGRTRPEYRALYGRFQT